MLVFNKKKEKTCKMKIYFTFSFLVITLGNNNPLNAMDNSDGRGELIKYLQKKHPEVVKELNDYQIEETGSITNFKNKRSVNSNDILLPALRAWVYAMTSKMFDYMETAIYNITLKYGENIAKDGTNIFLELQSSFYDIPVDKMFTRLLDPNKLNEMLIDRLIIDDFKEGDVNLNISSKPLRAASLKGAEQFVKCNIEPYCKIDPYPEESDLAKKLKWMAASYVRTCLIEPKRQKFSLKEIKEQTCSMVDSLIMEYIPIIIGMEKIDLENIYKEFTPIVAPVFLKKGKEDSKKLIISLLKPITAKLKIDDESLLTEKNLTEKKASQELNDAWEETIKKGVQNLNMFTDRLPRPNRLVILSSNNHRIRYLDPILPPFFNGLAPYGPPKIAFQEKQIFTDEEAADREFAKAKYYYGDSYYRGTEGKDKNAQEAFPRFKCAADLGHTEAQFRIGWMYDNGEGVNPNQGQAITYYTFAADKGHVESQSLLGNIYYKEKKYKESFYYYSQAADNGYSLQLMSENPSLESLNSIKQGKLGLFCEGDKLFCKIHNEEKIEIIRSDDFSKGIHSESFDRILKTLQEIMDPIYYQAGVAQEDERQHKAAYNFYDEAFEKVTPEDEKALFQYTLLRGYTTDNGDAYSQYCVGFMRNSGQGAEKNLEEAIKYCTRAAEKGNINAKQHLVMNFSNSNDSNVQYHCGLAYEKGEGVEKNPEEAVKCYIRAGNNGNQKALGHFKEMYINGKGIPKNNEDKIKYYQLAVNQKYPGAMNNLGALYYNSNDKKDHQKAFHYFKEAAKAESSAAAMHNCHLCYKQGRGVGSSNIYAIGWYILAAWNGQEETSCFLRMSLKSLKLCNDNVAITVGIISCLYMVYMFLGSCL